MNENVLGFIKWAAGIVITLAIISIAFIVFNIAKDGTMAGINKISAMNAMIAESDITIYDNQEVSGSEVVNVIRKFNKSYLAIRVITGKDRTGTWYGYNASISTSSGIATISAESSSDIADTIDEKNTRYINPNGRFLGKVFRDENGAAVAIVFTQN